MMNNNKILTVSYGTFSCTLEGFEDSFGTMKAIAEYFRDLAADDRYFGAEPPQPDAEMLARIAQKEVSRRVEARHQDGQIVLSALSTDPVMREPAPVVAFASDPEDVVVSGAGQDEDMDEAVAEESAVKAPPAAPVLRAVETPKPRVVEEVEEIAFEDEDAAFEDAEEDDDDAMLAAIGSVTGTPAEADAAESVEEELEAEENDVVPGQPDAAVGAFFDNADAATTADQDAFEDEDAAYAGADNLEVEISEVKPAVADNSIASKLQRIRAVVSRRAEPEVPDAYLEDEHAESDAAPAEPTALIAEARSDIEDALMADEVADAVAGLTLADAEVDADVVEAEEVYDEEVDEEEDALSALLSRVNRDTGPAEAEKVATDPAPVAQTDEEDEDDAEDHVGSLFADDAEDDEDEIAEMPEQPRARVIKVKRADLEAAIQKGDLEEVSEEEEDSASALDRLAPSKRGATTLSAEDEAELARELADLKADIDGEEEVAEADDVELDSEDEEDTAAYDMEDEDDTDDLRDRPSRRSLLPSLDEDENGDVHRLLTETDHQMDEPESAIRRDAFAHLRAAVAAKKADASIDDVAPGAKGVGAYRDDLAEVVRPRRPVSVETRTERPEEPRPAPLKLVAEQRIDVDHGASRAPVRPRRVAGQRVTESPADAAGFAEFAEDMGASSLPDLLEAAAAYLSFVEGREQFSRPQLMSKVRQVGGEEGFSREEGLRHFGQLLRKGKIEKIKGGRFTASEDIGFRPDERAAG